MKKLFCFTVDVEPLGRLKEKSLSMDLSLKGLYKVLDLLDMYNAKATFFVNGEFLTKEGNKAVIEIKNKGHEIAAHSYHHEPLKYKNSNVQFREVELITNKLRKLGINPKGFRAPQCSFDETTTRILKQMGYKYDSSLHPTFIPCRYNNLLKPRKWFYVSENFLEIPISVIPILRLPMSWIWFRNLGLRYVKFFTDLVLNTDGYMVFYVHSWEFCKLPSYLPFYYSRRSEIMETLIQDYLEFVDNKAQFKKMEELYDNLVSKK